MKSILCTIGIHDYHTLVVLGTSRTRGWCRECSRCKRRYVNCDLYLEPVHRQLLYDFRDNKLEYLFPGYPKPETDYISLFKYKPEYVHLNPMQTVQPVSITPNEQSNNKKNTDKIKDKPLLNVKTISDKIIEFPNNPKKE